MNSELYIAGWEWESFEEFINDGGFSITNAGPLHAPISSFSIKRDDKLELILETVSTHHRLPKDKIIPGTVRNNTDTVELTNYAGDKIILHGVQPYSHQESISRTGTVEARETSSLHFLEATGKNVGEAKYTIDWLVNVNEAFYLWPDSIVDEVEVIKNRALLNDTLAIKSSEKSMNRRRGCVKIHVGDLGVYLGVVASKSNNALKKGFILYTGTPSGEIREKIRICLSFFLGMYLVYLGHSNFDANWQLVSFKAVGGYSLDGKVFDRPPMPPAHLGGRGANEINSQFLEQMVNALLADYDNLKFTHLSWLYWHAVSAPAHAVAVLMGAAIEALQDAYIEKYRVSTTKLLEDAHWNELKQKINDAVTAITANNDDESLKAILLNKIGDFNKAPQNIVADRLFDFLTLKLGEAEKRAWRQRNDGAHGKEIRDGDFVQLIRDNKLLTVRFHKMLLRMTGASDNYYDYYTPSSPWYIKKGLQDPIE